MTARPKPVETERVAGMLMRILACGTAAAALLAAQQSQNFPLAELRVLQAQDGIYMLAGAGGNITVQIGKNGVLLVDTGLAQYSDKIYSEIRKLTNKPLRFIVDTHMHPDHVGGNEALAKKGGTIAGGNVVGNIGESAEEGATIVAHQSVMDRMSAKPEVSQPAIPFGMLPTDTYSGDEKELYFNGEAIELIHISAAHTDGDTIVFFRRSDVVSTGDLFTPSAYPFIDVARGGSVKGLLEGLNRILDITIPAEKQEGGTMVIPGHGRLCDEADVVEYRDMVTIVRDRVQDMVKKGKSLAEVKAARPTLDYDPLYAPGNTADAERFIDGIYNSLTGKK